MTRRRLIFFVALMALFAGSIVAWTGTSTSLSLSIRPYGYDENDSDAIVGSLLQSVTPIIGETFSIMQGAAQKIEGIELYEIVLTEQDDCDDVEIYLTLLNGYDIDKVLSNPHAFIDVGIWYPVKPEGAQDSVDLDRTGQELWRDEGGEGRNVSAVISEAKGTAVLEPSKTVTSTLHILASIVVPGGAPPGQEDQQQLEFWIEVKK